MEDGPEEGPRVSDTHLGSKEESNLQAGNATTVLGEGIKVHWDVREGSLLQVLELGRGDEWVWDR